MADGETHYFYLVKGWYVIIPLSVALLFIPERGYLYSLFLIFNFFLCRYFDPDDDQPGMTSTEGRISRDSKKVYMGFIGATINSYKVIYAYFAGLFGGHRSSFSHGIGKKGFEVISTGTIPRVVIYNVRILILINSLDGYAVQAWGWSTSISMWKSFYMDIWFIPYISTQLVAWFIGDTIHLVLDTEYAKGPIL